jgi:hypothetical protein
VFGASVERGDRFNEGDPGFFGSRGVVTDAARDDEELTRTEKYGTAICFGAADAEESTEDEKHLVLMFMRVPGELALYLCHFDVLIVDLTDDSRRPQLPESGAGKFEGDGVLLGLLGLLLFEFVFRRHRGEGLVAETGADGDLVTALGATTAEDGGAGLGLHAREEAVGLGAVTAVGLKGTLRHDKNSCGRRRLPLKLLAIAAISEYTRWDGIFTGLLALSL